MMQRDRFGHVAMGLLWSIGYAVLYFGIAVVAYFGSVLATHWIAHWAAPIFQWLIAIGGTLAATWVVRVKLNRRAWAGMALPRPQVGRLLLGAVCGALVILAVCLVEYLLGWLHAAPVSAKASASGPDMAIVLLALIPSIGVGFCEELAFRGYVFQTLYERMHVGAAAVITGIIFGLLHFTLPGYDVTFVVSMTLISIMFITMRLVTGSLWFAIGFHALWDWTQTYVVGLSTTGSPHDHSLVHVVQSGPSFWVGRGQAIESGMLFMLAAVVITILFLACGYKSGRIPPIRK